MSFEELGARLRALRQSRGYNLEDAANQIKLSERTLASIEEGRQSDLPHTSYAKGFVRTYARFLGMSDEEIAESLATAFPVEEEDLPPVRILRQPKKQGNTYVILLVLCLLAAGGWYAYSKILSKSSEYTAVPPVQNSSVSAEMAAANNPDEPEKKVTAGEGTAENMKAENLEPETASGEQAAGAESEKPDSGPSSHPEAEISEPDVEGPVYFESGRDVKENESESAQPGTAAPGKKHRVVITATEECWIKAITDKGDERPFNLPKNQSSVFTFDKFLKLRLGNVAGVKIRYNGRDFPIPPGSNTRDLVFPPEGD